jgi:kinesin family protein 18/19
MLKDSIGGNCRTVMISNISPSSVSFEDTYNTLKYADRAKRIKIKLKKNILSVDFHVGQYAKIVETMKRELDDWKAKAGALEKENTELKEEVRAELYNQKARKCLKYDGFLL